jgi:ATP-dependent DNA helicase PIF1
MATVDDSAVSSEPKRIRLDDSGLAIRQRKAIQYATDGASFFLTGAAGTGKSFIIAQMVKELEKLGRKIAITASTGSAALLIGGTTLHSFAGIGAVQTGDTLQDLLDRVYTKPKAVDAWLNVQTLIIDEISMISDELFTQVEYIGRKIRGGVDDDMFGGIQIIAVGDFLQLPPVEGNYAFMCDAWKNTFKNRIVLLNDVFRQSDPLFIRGLHAARKGIFDAEFAAAVSKTIDDTSEFTDEKKEENIIRYTMLYSTKSNVEQINIQELKKLKGDLEVFLAKDYMVNENLGYLFKHFPVDDKLLLKVGAQIVFVKNTPSFKNGTRGVITEIHTKDKEGKKLEEPYVKVKLRNGSILAVGQIAFELIQRKKVVVSRKCFPMRLAWALTIHKSQGMTLDMVQIDLTTVFAPAQAYTALSRAQDLKSLRVIGLAPEKVFCDEENAKPYYEELEKLQD